MIQPLDWREDAMVRLEKRLYPLQARVLRSLLPNAPPDDALVSDLRAAAAALRGGQARYFDRYDIALPEDARAAFAGMAARLDALAERAGSDAPPFDGAQGPEDFAAALEQFLDIVREAFLGVVLARQAEAQHRSETAAREVAAISRQIYFISINAAVEAARAGAAGRGFAVIGTQIRSLSHEATEALRRLTPSGPAGR